MATAIKLTRNEDGSVTASYADSTSKASTVKLSTGSSSKSSRSSGSSSSRSSSSSSSGSNGATKVMVRNGYTITATPTKTGYESPNYDHEEPYTDAFGNVRYYPADQYGNSTGAWHSNLIVPDYSKKPADQSYGSYFSDLNFGYNQEYEDQYVYYRPASMVPTITIRKNDSSGSSGSGSGGSSVSSYQGGGIAAMRGDSGYDSDGGSVSYGSSGSYGYGSYLDAQNVLIDAQISAILSQLNSGKQTINQMAGDAARQALAEAPGEKYLVYFEYPPEGEPLVRPVTAEELAALPTDAGAIPGADWYLVDKDFTWTYVQTHEADCGPYFCRRG